MKTKINGKTYNTDTAKLVGYYKTPLTYSDFGFYMESLYRKRTGEYFLHGDGGPMTKYAKSCADGSIGWGEAIIPMTEAKAAKWLERRKDSDNYTEAW